MGIDPNAEQAVMDKVNEWTAANEMFTAWDVTKSLRNEVGIQIGHLSETRPVVHRMYNSMMMPSNYARERRDFVDAKGQARNAFVFFPQHRQHETYDPQALGGSSDPSTVSPPLQAAAPDPVDPNLFKIHSRGRLTISNALLSQIGVHALDAVVTVREKTNLTIRNGAGLVMRDAVANVRHYKVDKSGNVRLPASLIDNRTDLRVVIEGGAVIVQMPEPATS